MRRLHHMSISREGLIYLAVMGVILTAAIIRQINLLMLLYGVLAGPLLISWSLVRRTLKGLDVARKLPKTVMAGERFCVELVVTNAKRRSSFAVTARDEMLRRESGAKPIGTEVYFPYVPPKESRAATYVGVLEDRGAYDFQPIKISTRFPLGLLRTMLRIEKPQRLLVLPRVGKLAPQWQRLWKADEDAVGGPRRRGGLQEGDFYGLREWRSGDARSRIHWRTSARRQALTVRQYERKRQLIVTLVIDLWQPEKPSADDRRLVEEVVSMAATVAAEVCREGGRMFTMEIVGKTTRSVRAASSPQALEESLKNLAQAEATSNDRLGAALETTFAQLRAGANVLIVGTRKLTLDDAAQFPQLAARPDIRAWVGRAATLTPNDPLWRQLYRRGESP
ncbi:MAG: hypothetical protein C0483_04430 [Pirellula sp.]|nr:hypothetical protein [Pirellula sp.]